MKLSVEAISDELKFYLNQLQDYITVLEIEELSGKEFPNLKVIFTNDFIGNLKNDKFQISNDLYEIFPELLLSNFPNVVNAVLKSGLQQSVEHVVEMNKTEYWLRTKVVKFSASRIICFSENITQLKHKENINIEISSMLKEAHKVLKMNCYDLDLTTQIIYSDTDMADIFDMPHECYELSLNDYFSYIEAEQRDLARNTLKENIKNGTPFIIERKFVSKNNRARYLEITGKPIMKFDRCTKVIGTFRDITKRKEEEFAVLNTKEKLLEAQKLLKMGNWEFDFEKKKHFYSIELSEILEYETPVEFHSFNDYFKHVDEDEKFNSLDGYPKLVSHSNSVHIDRKLISAKGNIKYVEFVSKTIGENQTKIFGTFRDITEKKLQELALIENEKRLMDAQQYLKTGTWEYNTDTKIIKFSNESYSLVNGKIPQETHLADYFKYVNLKFRDKFYQSFINSTQKNQQFKIVNHLCFEDGSFKYIEIIGNPSSKSKLNKKYNGTFRDVTEDWKKDLAIKDSEEKFKLLFDSNPTIYFTLDENGFMISINQFGIDYFGYTKNEIVGQHISKVFYTEDIKKAMKNLDLLKFSSEDFLQWEIRKVKKSGEIIWVKETARLAKSRQGKSIYLIVCEDITSEVLNRNLIRKKQQELILAKEKAEVAALEKQQFASIMSHEVRTPLNAVIGMTNILLMDDPRPNQIEELNTLKFAAENLLVLVNDILDFSKIESGKVILENISFDLPLLVNNLKNSYHFNATDKGIKINAVIDEEIPNQILGDPTRISQVLNNLVSNAIKFTEEGFVDVSVRKLEMDENKILVRFEVSDSGIGIAPEKHHTIFESFSQANSDTTRKYGGTGLGLTITKKLIELHNSQIFIDSEIGRGSTFYFDINFELSKDKALQIVSFDNVDNNKLADKKILLVEDNPFNQLIARKFLEKWHAIVETADNGILALEKLTVNKYDLILMDIQMPEMDGIETTKAIRKHRDISLQKIPIIALTAVAMENDKEKLLKDGMNDYISKPFNPNELFKKITMNL